MEKSYFLWYNRGKKGGRNMRYSSVIKDGKTKYWAYAYIPARSKDGKLAVHLQPTLGVVAGRKFYPINRNGKILTSKSHSIYGLEFVETAEKAIDNYNDLVKAHARSIEEQLKLIQSRYIPT